MAPKIRTYEEWVKDFHSKYERMSAKECWPWKKCVNGNGYGHLYLPGSAIGRKRIRAHRASWIIHYGELPKNENICVLHACDNPKCVNPNHLWLGTQQENIRDMRQKGRARDLRGEESPNAKLTEEQVRAIYMSSFGNKRLSRKYAVSPSVISNIQRGMDWKHVTESLGSPPKRSCSRKGCPNKNPKTESVS